jgi:hypothetical protein
MKQISVRSARLFLLLIILAFAVFLRLPTFKLPHDNGDQLFYLGLAMKLDGFGFSGYTLRGIDLKGNNSILGLFPAKEQKGSLLKDLDGKGVHYYDEPLFHRPYGFPYILMLSHRIFADDGEYLTLNTSGRDERGRVYSEDAKRSWGFQFYAVFIPFLFSIFFILATYFLAKLLFSERIALISAFLISISPVEMLSSQRIWADTMLSFFVVLTVLFFFLAREKKNLSLSFMAGITCGIAVLVKQTAGFILIVFLFYHLWQNKSGLFKLNKVFRIIFDKYLIAVALGMLIVSFHWFFIVTKTYGHPLYMPSKTGGIEYQSEWFMILSQRPRFLYLFSIPYLVPIFALVYFSIIAGPFIRGFINDKKVFLIIWLLSFLGAIMILGAKENRYMLPAYPAIAMLSADLLQKIGCFINKRLKGYFADAFIIVILLACAFWSVSIGLRHISSNSALILKPF